MNKNKTKNTAPQNSGKKNFLQRTWETLKRVFKTPSAKVGGILFAIIVLASIFAPWIAPYGPNEMDLRSMYATPSAEHLFGTDGLGRDIFSRLLYGGKYSLTLGLVAACVGQTCGVVLGSISGFFGGKTDMTIMRFLDIWQAVPGVLMSIILSSVLGPGFVNTIIAMSIGSIPRGARMTRGQILAERGKEYIEAAESINCRAPTIMFSHLLPNVISPTLVSATMDIGHVITSAAGLSYLGLGIQPPTPEWGAMLSDGTNYLRAYPHMVLFPGLILGVCVLSINLMGDGVRDAMDPKLRN